MYDGCRTHRCGPLPTTFCPASTSTVVRTGHNLRSRLPQALVRVIRERGPGRFLAGRGGIWRGPEAVPGSSCHGSKSVS